MCQFCIQHGDGQRWYLNAENYVADLESDLARREYLIGFVQGFKKMHGRAQLGTSILGVLPGSVSSAVKGRINRGQQEHHFGQPVPIEECEQVFEMATSIVQLPCVCRNAAGMPEEGYCLAVTALPIDAALKAAFSGFADGPDTTGLERLTKDQAMDVLRRCESEGLMHSVWTFITPFIGAICNCDLGSGCMAMDMTLGHDIKVMWRGEYVIDLSAEECTGCGACVKRCPFQAIDKGSGKREPVSIRLRDCYGCGVCRVACPSNALRLLERQSVPEAALLW
ncbi:MAG: 4Fe-4S binding protein [Actinobacteria bacterium]|nr:4Fe-4S binding protein [Actinomycetota bacterium]MCG2807993.1 4Fe-4S binding protein [Coriobacteriia bacterium]